jgi:transketolase
MRNKLFHYLNSEMKKNPRIVLLFADMGKGIIENFSLRYPERTLNIGIAEQNLISMAAGMAAMGYAPYCYTISNFITERCYEQIRNDICIPGYKVVLIGTSTGFDSGTEGVSHFSLEDIGIMKTLPNFNIYAPSTIDSVESCFQDIKAKETSSYIRLGKFPLEVLHEKDCNYFVLRREKPDVLFITYGDTLEYCYRCGLHYDCVSVFAMNRIVPLDTVTVRNLLIEYKQVIIVEEQLEQCGLYNSICQEIITNRLTYHYLEYIAIKEYCKQIGSRSYFARHYGYSVERLIDYIDCLLNS